MGQAIEIVRIPAAGGGDAVERLREALAAGTDASGYLAPPRCAWVRAYASSPPIEDGAAGTNGEALPAGEPGEVVVVVAWSSRAAHDEAAAEPAAAAFFAAVGELAAGPPQTGWYDELRP